jgi:hypothetical protein
VEEAWKVVRLVPLPRTVEGGEEEVEEELYTLPVMPEVTLMAIPARQYPIKQNKLNDINKQMEFIPKELRGFYLSLSANDTAEESNRDDNTESDVEPSSSTAEVVQ